MNEEIKTKFEIELSEVKDCSLLDGRGSLFYCVIRRDGEHLYTCQARTVDRACLLALQLLSEDLVDLELGEGLTNAQR